MPLFRKVQSSFSLKTLVKDSNCVLIQDPSAIWGGSDHLPRRNLLLNTDTLATQNVTVTAEAHTLYLQGTGSVTLSGTGSGTLQGTGANDRVSLVFTPTAGTLTLTVSGTVTFGMLCKSSVIDRSYQKITDWTTEQYAWAAQNPRLWLRRNRFLSTATLSTQTVSAVTANPLTVSFTGTGTITFSTAYSGSLVGTGANDRVTATFTPAAGNLVCTVTGTVTLAQCEVGGTATPYQEVGASWGATYTALALAAGYPISLYSDRAGTTATVGPDDPVGVLLDQSEGLALGPELVSNGGFDSDVSGWTATLTATWSSGKARLSTNTAATRTFAQGFNVTAGNGYLISCGSAVSISGTASVTITVRTSAADNSTFLAGASLNIGSETRFYYVAASTTTVYVAVQTFTSASQTIEVDNISIKQVLGYHATAPSDAARPNLRLDGNGKFYLDRDTTDDALAITWPANYTTTAVQYVADQSVTTETTGITLNGATSYTTPQRPTGDYGRIIFKTPTSNAAKVKKYLDKKAGR
jgi:hypothetical protein